MKLLTKELEKKFEAVGITASKPLKDIKVIAKFFNPAGAGTWFAVEYQPEDRVFFGYVTFGDPFCAELGYFSLDELESFRGPFGLGIERDLHFRDHTLEEVVNRKGVL